MLSIDSKERAFPFRALSDRVCMIDIDSFDEFERFIFDAAFALFGYSEKYRRFAGDVMHSFEGLGTFHSYNLPRRRYYALCNNRKMENIHMCYEIKAYCPISEIGPINLMDASRDFVCARYDIEPRDNSIFTLITYEQFGSLFNVAQRPEHLRGIPDSEAERLGYELGRKFAKVIARKKTPNNKTRLGGTSHPLSTKKTIFKHSEMHRFAVSRC